ncbi:MAG: ribonuclease HII [Coxiella sp. DG_40]|nr:MAG: ribonuclease HII [Coxiella sp. DG_40]
MREKTSMLIAGVDEVGRGPLAGPVVAAAVILNSEKPIDQIRDSKSLSEKAREQFFSVIRKASLAWSVGRAEVHEIDKMNILQASLLAMERAVRRLKVKPDQVLVDGKHCPKILYPVKAIINGDQTVPVISAASVIAKVIRDREMVIYDAYYPEYGFAAHKGYGTKQHLEAIAKHNITPIHRRSFRPIKDLLLASI